MAKRLEWAFTATPDGHIIWFRYDHDARTWITWQADDDEREPAPAAADPEDDR